ncbi:hypothetical protein SEVIR_2G060550v4 [Setaria viridis]|uniref:Uncharacterized protein n=1 Tax=Setaria viridis TaxID=4556 RepID=A0A4U6VSG3_SETVI|nr:hypothetical protein SEVIR_2G060550v2 [Setaria viridis]
MENVFGDIQLPAHHTEITESTPFSVSMCSNRSSKLLLFDTTRSGNGIEHLVLRCAAIPSLAGKAAPPPPLFARSRRRRRLAFPSLASKAAAAAAFIRQVAPPPPPCLGGEAAAPPPPYRRRLHLSGREEREGIRLEWPTHVRRLRRPQGALFPALSASPARARSPRALCLLSPALSACSLPRSLFDTRPASRGGRSKTG